MRQKYDEGQRVEAEKRNKEGYKHKGKLEKEYKEIMGEERKMNSGKDALFALTPTDAGATFVKGLKKKGINVQKIRDDILKEKMKSKEFRIGIAKGKTKASDDDDKKYRVYKKGGGVRKNSSRMNKLEELGRVDSEKAYSSKGKRNLKAEKKRIVKSLNSRGAAKRGHGAEIR